MSGHNPDIKYETPPSLYFTFIITVLITVPGLYFGLLHAQLIPWVGSLVFGIAIFGAAFILSWAAEAVQIDISESLAVAILALLAVLPEYAVDFVFTWAAGKDFLHNIPMSDARNNAHFAIANMTGANRLLVGLGWPFILLLYIVVKKKKAIILEEIQRVEIFYLAMATLYSFTIPLKGSLNLIDMAILVTLFGLYTRRAAQMETVEPELVGPVKIVANLRKVPRRILTYSMFAYAAVVIYFVAHPFAVSLVDMGKQFGIKEFLLVQWLAPIASESPEFIIAATWTIRGAAGSAMKALISSKVNQWTLLVGTIPLVFAISSQTFWNPFPLDSFQQSELFLTAAQSLFAVAVLVNLKLSRLDGLLLFVLFASQLIVEKIRWEVTIIYLILAVVFHIFHRKDLIPAMKIGLDFKKK